MGFFFCLGKRLGPNNALPLPLPAGCQKVKSHQLVPGDTLVLTEGKSFLPCDAVLISGRCIVNESMLTGTHHAVLLLSLLFLAITAMPRAPLYQALCTKHFHVSQVRQTQGRGNRQNLPAEQTA